MKKMVCALGACLLIAGVVQAAIIKDDVIYVDFGEDFSGGHTNNISSSVANSLSIASAKRLSDGVLTGVGIAATSSDGSWTEANTVAGNMLSQDILACGDALGRNNGNGSTISITFTGLDDSLTYDLMGGLSSTAAPEKFGTGWTIANQASETKKVTDGSVTGGYISFDGLTSTDGELIITLDRNGVSHLGVSQLSLTAIPEPATLGMVAAFGGGILFVRRLMQI